MLIKIVYNALDELDFYVKKKDSSRVSVQFMIRLVKCR